MLAMGRHSSLLQKFVIYNRKKIHNIVTCGQCYETFYGRKFRLFWCSTLGQAPGLTHKHQTRLERLAKDKHSTLFKKFVTYGRKKIHNIVTCGLCYKTFYGRKLPLFRCSTLGQAPVLTHKHQTRLESLAKDKHSSLLQKIVTYDRKKFYKIVP